METPGTISLGAACAAVVLTICALPTAAVRGEVPTTATSATISPSLAPDRLGSRAALTISIRYAGGKAGVPYPVRRSLVRLPAGLSLDIPTLRSCTVAHLLAHGAHGCPPRSLLGVGRALVEVHAGSQTLREHVSLRAFLGPLLDSGQPSFEVMGRGYSPLDRRVVFTGTVLASAMPYGEALSLSLPPIPTLPFEPDASIVSFSLTVGARGARMRTATAVLVPASCPAGGFPFAAEFTYADGSTSSALATARCPQ
jgi:hypothetical protein